MSRISRRIAVAALLVSLCSVSIAEAGPLRFIGRAIANRRIAPVRNLVQRRNGGAECGVGSCGSSGCANGNCR